MRNIHGVRKSVAQNAASAVDTTFVLFFLALEFGRVLNAFGFDGVLLGITLLMVAVVPYFFYNHSIGADFGRWLTGRMAIAAFGTVLGLALELLSGTILPVGVRYLPMLFLIASAMISCYMQFYGLLRLRPAK